MAKKTFYDALQVSRNADPETITAAYKNLVQRYHPDKNPDNPDAEKNLKIINRAYEVLSDPVKRAVYDAALAEDDEDQSTCHRDSREFSAGVRRSWTIKTMHKAVLMVLLVSLSINSVMGRGWFSPPSSGAGNSDTAATLSLVQCNQVASKANENLPMMVDKITRLENTVCVPNGSSYDYIYNYTMLEKKADIAANFMLLIREQLIGMWCNNPKTKNLLGMVPSVKFIYSDIAYARIGETHISKQDCR